MHRSTLIHFVDQQELAKAQDDYLPLARKSITPEAAGALQTTLTRQTHLLRATLPHHFISPVMRAIDELATDIHSFDYYKKRFMKFLGEGFENKHKQRAIFELVENSFAQMPAPQSIDDGINALCAIVDHFAAEYQIVISEINNRLQLGADRDSPKTVFMSDGLLEGIRGLYRRNLDDSRIMYRRQIRDVCGALLEWINNYTKDMAQRGRDPDEPNDEDKAECLKVARSLFAKEIKTFTDKCTALKEAIRREAQYMHSVKKIKEIALDKVASLGGDNFINITAKIENLPPENSDTDVDSFINKVKIVIEQVERDKDGQETKKHYSEYAPDLADLDLSPQERRFLLRYLNPDHLVGVTHYHRDEVSRYFNIPKNAITENLKLGRNAEGDLLVHIEERYRELHRKADEPLRGYISTQADRAKSVTTLRIRQQLQGPEVSVIKSELHLYDNALRQHYLSSRLFEDKGILQKILTNQPLLKNDHAVIDLFTQPYRQTENWAVNLAKLEDKSADEIFVACWRDEFTMKHFFEAENYKTPSDVNHPLAAQFKRHREILQRFCQAADPLQRILCLQNKYPYHDMGMRQPIAMMEKLKTYLSFVQQGNWKTVAKLLNQEESRDLMMAAMNSLTDLRAIKKALDISAIRYSLDENTLTHFAMQHENVASKILKQSVWQRLAVRISQRFNKRRFWGVPAQRLMNTQVAKIASKFPRLWQTRLKKHGQIYYSLTGHRNFRSEMTRKEMMQIPDKTIFSDSDLWSKIAEPIANQQEADLKLRLLASHGFSYSDRQSLKYGQLFSRGFSAAADQASDSAIEEFFFAQFNRLCNQENYEAALSQAVSHLWNGQMDLPHGPNIVPCAKRAMIRVIRLHPEMVQIFDGVEGRVYRDLLEAAIADDVILAAFVLQEDFLAELRRRATDDLRAKIVTKIQNSIHLVKEGYATKSPFTKSHLVAAFSLFTFDERVLREHKVIGEAFIDLLLNQTDHSIEQQLFKEKPSIAWIISFLANASGKQLITLLLRQPEEDPFGFYQNAKKAILENPVLYKRALDVVQQDAREQPQHVNNDNNAAQRPVPPYVTSLPWQNLATLCNAQPEIMRLLLTGDLLTDYAGGMLTQHYGFRNLSPSELSNLKAIANMGEYVKDSELRWRNWQDTLVRETLQEHVKDLEPVVPIVVKQVKSLLHCFKAIEDPNQLMIELVEIVKTCTMECPDSLQLKIAAKLCGHKNINHLNVFFALSKIFNDYSLNSRLFANSAFKAESAVQFYEVMIKQDQNAFSGLLKTFTTNILTVACRNSELRKQILSSQDLQKYIGQYASTEQLILFLQCAAPKRTSIDAWHVNFAAYFAQDRVGNYAARAFNNQLQFALQHVDGFAGWALAHLARHPHLQVAQDSLLKILQYRVRGSDLLRLIRRPEYHDCVRNILVDVTNADLFNRILDHQFDLHLEFPDALSQVPDNEYASDLIHLLMAELNENPRAEPIVNVLTSEKMVHYMLSFANGNEVLMLLRRYAIAIPHMIRLFTENDEIRKKVFAEHDLLSFLLANAHGNTLIDWVSAYPQCAAQVLANDDLSKLYLLVSGDNGRAELLLSAIATRHQQAANAFMPQVMNAFPAGLSAKMIAKVLRVLINYANANEQNRNALYTKLQSLEMAQAMTRVDADTLYDLYMNCHDIRAVKLLFYNHPVCQENLMARIWYSASADQILNMLSLSYDVQYKLGGAPASYASKMLGVLLQYLNHANEADLPRSNRYADHLLKLFAAPELLHKMISIISINQLDQLLASNSAVATKVMDYFKAYPDQFRSVLLRGANRDNIRKFEAQFHVRQSSLLEQMTHLFAHHTAVRDLFVEQIKEEPDYFAEMVVNNIKQTDDYRAAVNIVNQCVKVLGSDFYAMFVQRGYTHPTMIFLLYVMVGGDAMRQLYNTGQQTADRRQYKSHIATLSRLWELCCQQYNDHPEYKNYLVDLRSRELAGDYISLQALLGKDARHPISLIQAVNILHKLLQIRTLLAKDMLNSNWLEQLHANGEITREEFYLFSSALKELLKLAESFVENSTPMQLVQLMDVESSPFEDLKPMRNFLLSHDKSLARIVKDHQALAALLATRGYKEHVGDAENLKEILSSINESFVNTSHSAGRYLKVKGKMDFVQCNVDQYQIYMASREYHEFCKELGFNVAHARNFITLFELGDDDQTRINGLAQHPTTNQIMDPKYLTCYYYSRFLTDSAEFIRRLVRSDTFRENFCRQFEFNPESPDPITLALSGVKPAGDLMVMYVFARSLSDQNFVDRNLFAYLLNHAVVRRDGENFRFAGTFRYVPEEILEYFQNDFTRIRLEQYKDHWLEKFEIYEQQIGEKIATPADLAARENDSIEYVY